MNQRILGDTTSESNFLASLHQPRIPHDRLVQFGDYRYLFRTQLEEERVAVKDALEQGQAGVAALAPGRARMADATEGVGARVTAEGSRDLLLPLEQAPISLRLIVVAGNGDVV